MKNNSVEPGLALTSWIGFKEVAMGKRVMMMGDLALLEREVAPVTAKLAAFLCIRDSKMTLQ